MAKVSAVDIQHKTFRKALQGYDRAEVDQFLDDLMESLEEEAGTRASLEKEVADLRERIQHFRAMEESLQNTLLLAQRTADEVKSAAHHKSELILEEARAAAGRESGILDARLNDARRELQQAIHLSEKAKNDLRGMLTSYMQMLEKPLVFQAPVVAGTDLRTSV